MRFSCCLGRTVRALLFFARHTYPICSSVLWQHFMRSLEPCNSPKLANHILQTCSPICLWSDVKVVHTFGDSASQAPCLWPEAVVEVLNLTFQPCISSPPKSGELSALRFLKAASWKQQTATTRFVHLDGWGDVWGGMGRWRSKGLRTLAWPCLGLMAPSLCYFNSVREVNFDAPMVSSPDPQVVTTAV